MIESDEMFLSNTSSGGLRMERKQGAPPEAFFGSKCDIIVWTG